jgi:flavin reductase (DIM6/NTAB) family NADH-FMN oxidoreductase RutF
MAKINWKGSTLLGPLPTVMVSCGTMEKSNIITVAWTGILNTHPPKTYISVRPQRHSYQMIKQSGEFTLNLTPARLVRAADYCGMYTGAKVDKFAKCGLTKEQGHEVACPSIAECPLSLECRVSDVIPLGTHDMFIADIVSVRADETLLDESGKLCMERADLAAFTHGEYFALGKKIGKFGFWTAKKKKGSKNAPKSGTKRRKTT